MDLLKSKLNIQVKPKGIYEDTFRMFAEDHPECVTYRDIFQKMLETLPHYKRALQKKKELAGAGKS